MTMGEYNRGAATDLTADYTAGLDAGYKIGYETGKLLLILRISDSDYQAMSESLPEGYY